MTQSEAQWTFESPATTGDDSSGVYGLPLPVDRTADAASLYLDVLKRSLTGALAEDNDSILGGVRTAGSTAWKRRLGNVAGRAASRADVEIVYKKPYDPKLRESRPRLAVARRVHDRSAPHGQHPALRPDGPRRQCAG